MIYTEDNFLSPEQFNNLKIRSEKRFTRSNGSLMRPGDDPVRVTYHGADGNWQEGCKLLGSETIPAVEKIIATLEKLGVKNLMNWSVWFQYLGSKQNIPIHCDQGLRFSSQKNTFTCALYLSDWEEGMGGEWISGSPVYEDRGNKGFECVDLVEPLTIVKPIPNRLLIWSRDNWHRVLDVNVSDIKYKRTFFGTGWSSINDSQTWKNVH